MRLVDDATFGRRAPFHHFEKSKSETLYAAFLVVLHHIERLTRVARSIDPAVTEQLCEGLVQLQEPLRPKLNGADSTFCSPGVPFAQEIVQTLDIGLRFREPDEPHSASACWPACAAS